MAVAAFVKKEYKRKKHMNKKFQGKKLLCFLLSILMVRLLCPVSVGAGESTLPVAEGSDITIETTAEPEGSEGTTEITSAPDNSTEQTENTSTESEKSDGETENTSPEPEDSGEETENTSPESEDSGGETENTSTEPGDSDVETENTSSEPENSEGTTEIISESETGDIAAVNLLAALDSGENVSENNTTKSNTSGDVSYIITIPDQVGFGTLTQPETETDSYRFCEINVEATQLNNLTVNQRVAVYIKNSSSGDGRFHLTQQGASGLNDIPYDIYDHIVDEQTVQSANPVNRSDNSYEKGYLLCGFANNSVGTGQKAVLALNQKELYGKDLSEIAGSYSGTITFHSELITDN